MDGDESARRGSRATVETTGVAATPRAASSLEIGSARTVLASTLPAAATEHRLVEGEAIGRFAITRLLGRGGMGEVYAAHDPELGRSVAIKLLRPELSTTHADLRLRREARAMARLSHPNLVTVHDVGVHDGQLFVAMELIAGGTLRTWARGRRWREIVAAYVAAGRGLASAHEAGVVHRDFKPDNVLVGDDGRVAVGDFGLAMTSADDLPLEPSGGATFLTQAGTLLGTVRYMAPEQLAGRLADARSDQFAFCLSLWEALDEDPFGPLSTDGDVATTAQTRRAAIDEGPRRRKLAGVPARVCRALVRGLARDPAERWPAMTDLLDHLAPTRRRGLIAGAAVGLAALGLAITATWMLRAPAADPCDAAAAAMQAVWTPGGLQRLRSAFAPLHLPNGDDAASRTAAILDRRAAAWSIMRVDSCRATARGAQTAELDRRRTRCLDARLAETSGLVDALAVHPTADMIGRAIRAADALTAIESCGKVGALLERPAEPASAATRAQIAALDAEIARADAREKLGDPAIVPTLADLQRRAIAVDWPPAIAAIDLTIGHEAWRREDPAAAETALRAAALAAARAKDDDLGARALALLSEALVDADRASDAVEVARAAELLATRAGNPPELAAEVLESLASGDVGLSRFDEADRAYARAVDLLSHSRPGSVQLASALNNWSNQLFQRSDYARALPLSDRALALLRAQLGEHDPDYARALHNNGNLLVAAGRYPEAKARFEAALAIKQQLYGPDASTVAQTLHSLGNVAHETGEYARAAQLYTRAHEIWERTLGPDHSLTLMARYSLGLNLKDQHRPDEAIAVLDDVLARRSAAKDPQPAKIATTLDALAGCYTERGDLRKALALEQRALAIREKVLGPTTGDVADSLATIAELQGMLGDCTNATTAAHRAIEILHGLPGGDPLAGTPTLALAGCARGGDAIVLYRRAIELLAATPDAAHDRGRARLALATLLWPSDRAAARELATAAAQDLAHDPDLARATAWLDAHRL